MGLKTRTLSNFSLRDNSNKNFYPDTNTEVVLMEKYSDVSRIREIAEDLGISYYAVATILTNKSLKSMTEDEIRILLNADINKTHPVENYRETADAIAAIKKAVDSGEHIGVYGDYDGDGVTSTLIMSEVLADLTDSTKIHQEFSRIAEEGFGFSIHGLEELAAQGCKTIIVLDTGSNSVETLKRAKELGIKCIVMDHHEFTEGTEKLKDVIYVNPHLYPKLSNENELKNAGMSWYFARKLYQETTGSIPEKLHKELLGYAALGTISDAGNQLEGEYNRALLHFGLQPEVTANMEALPPLMNNVSSFEDSSARDIVKGIQILSLGKRISTVRPADVMKALANSTPAAERKEIIEKLYKNHEAFNTTADKASQEIIDSHRTNPASVVIEAADPKTVPSEFIGTSGSIAARVIRQLEKPAFIFVKNADGTYKGSYRVGKSKMDGLDLLTRLNAKYPDVMVTFGGHTVAGGITIENEEKLQEFKDLVTKFVDYQVKHEPSYIPSNIKMKESWNSDGKNKFFVTAAVPSANLPETDFSDVLKFTPYNSFTIKSPSFYTKGITYKGKKKDKLIFANEDGKTVEFVAADLPAAEGLKKGETCDVVFEVLRKDKSAELGLKSIQIL